MERSTSVRHVRTCCRQVAFNFSKKNFPNLLNLRQDNRGHVRKETALV